ncbi:MAG: hypothetical protein ABIT01_01930, partial [Thermoanaerobaculia bacterium]
ITALVDPFFEGIDADGVLGLNAYRELIATIDYPASRFRLEQGALPPADGKSVLAYRRAGHEEFTVSVSVAGKTMPAVLDTGASRALLIPRSAEGSFPYREPLVASREIASGPQVGSYHPREGILNGSLRLGAFEFPDPPITLNQASTVLIGSAILEKFVISLDQKHRRVRLQRIDPSPIVLPSSPRSKPAGPPNANPAGNARTVVFPDTPLGRRVSEYFEAFNSGDVARMTAFFERSFTKDALKHRSVSERLAVTAEIREVNTRFRVHRASPSTDGAVRVLAENAHGEWRQIDFQDEGDPEHHLGGMRLMQVEPPADASPSH